MKVIGIITKLLLCAMLCSTFVTFHLSASPYLYAGSNSLVINNPQQAARSVKGKFGGKVLKVQRAKVNGNPGYKVKLLKDNGHVVSIKVDAKSGQVSGR